MPSSTPNYSLAIYATASGDELETFIDYRTAIAGISAASNMSIIDTALGAHDVSIAALEARKNIIAVPATYDSPNTYVATVVAIASYDTNQVIALSLDTDTNGTITLNINALGAKSVMKVSSAGAFVNLEGSDMRATREYNCKYDGTRYVWMDATASDQININGTATNFAYINSDNELEDSGVKESDLATTALDNIAAVAINTTLASDTDDTDSLGTAAKAWKAFLGYATRLKEKAAATADVAGWGEFWVKTATPNIPMFTDDAGTDFTVANLFYSTATVTTGNVTAVEGQLDECTIAGLTANRDWNLPTPSAAGVRCAVRIKDGDADYSLVLKANSVEKTRLHTANEYVEFLSFGTGAGDWQVVVDGRVPSQSIVYDGNATTWSDSTDTPLNFTSASTDIGNCVDIPNDRVDVRRDGTYLWSARVRSTATVSSPAATDAIFTTLKVLTAAGDMITLRLSSIKQATRVAVSGAGAIELTVATSQWALVEFLQASADATAFNGGYFSLIEVLNPIS